jgi:hypothetical protein
MKNVNGKIIIKWRTSEKGKEGKREEMTNIQEERK